MVGVAVYPGARLVVSCLSLKALLAVAWGTVSFLMNNATPNLSETADTLFDGASPRIEQAETALQHERSISSAILDTVLAEGPPKGPPPCITGVRIHEMRKFAEAERARKMPVRGARRDQAILDRKATAEAEGLDE